MAYRTVKPGSSNTRQTVQRAVNDHSQSGLKKILQKKKKKKGGREGHHRGSCEIFCRLLVIPVLFRPRAGSNFGRGREELLPVLCDSLAGRQKDLHRTILRDGSFGRIRTHPHRKHTHSLSLSPTDTYSRTYSSSIMQTAEIWLGREATAGVVHRCWPAAAAALESWNYPRVDGAALNFHVCHYHDSRYFPSRICVFCVSVFGSETGSGRLGELRCTAGRPGHPLQLPVNLVWR